MLRCLAKDPAERPAGAAELSAHLARADVPRWSPDDARRWWQVHAPEEPR